MSDDPHEDPARRAFLRHLGAGVAAVGVASGTAAGGHEQEDDQQTSATPDEIIDRMTLEEKIERVHGEAWGVNPADEDITGYIEPTPRVNLPDVKMSDGPLGVRHLEATALPSTVGLAASFDRELMRSFGRVLGREAKAKDQDVVLAPGMNIIRVPELGRAFEYYSEDPHLNARTGVNVIEGVQETGTIATAKHYAVNNQEGAPATDAGSGEFVGPGLVARRGSRQYVNAVVGDRALREIYLPAFEAAVTDAGVEAIMAAYNRVNGTYATENARMLQGILKDEWGFGGYVVSDWTATRSVRAAANGLDLETPYGVHFDEPLEQAVRSGAIAEERLDDMVRRQLEPLDRIGVLDGDRSGIPGEQNTDRHQRLARDIAAEGAVLLKNDDGTLPIDPDGIDSIAVVGPEIDSAKVGGGGSSDVMPPYSVSPLEGIRARVGDDVRVRYTTGEENTTEAVTIAESSDVAVVFGQGSSTEGRDRYDIVLDGNQNRLVADVAAANDDTVVVLNTGGPVTMPWVEDVPAVLEMWYPGMEDGNATADVLFGDVVPGGKLPVTFGRRREDYPADDQQQYPGVGGRAEYSEGVFVGYRHFDEAGNEPLFPFGHGLSYSEFEFSELQVTDSVDPEEGVAVSVTVDNVGDEFGKEVVQIYVGERQPAVDRPPRELRAFEKVALGSGQQTTVRFDLGREALSYYDETAQTWRIDPGTFRVWAGASSRDLRLAESFTVTDGMTYGGGTSVADGRVVE